MKCSDKPYTAQGACNYIEKTHKTFASKVGCEGETMKVAMINDCAFVGETLIKYLPEDLRVFHLKRARRFFDKTLGIAWKILRSEGDLYHVHYLLQDCYLALKFGKRPIIGHAHGSDVRDSIRHFIWGRIVRHNLEKCDKIVVSTPNLLKTAKEYNESAEYIPNLVDDSIFYPRARDRAENRLRVLIAVASDWNVKGTDKIIRALKRIEEDVNVSIIKYGVDIDKTLKLAKNLGLCVTVLPSVSHTAMPEYYWSADTVIASIGIGEALGMVALEAIACGRPVITRVSSEFSEYKAFPLLDISTPEEIADAILSSTNENLWKKEYEYLRYYHNPKRVTKRFMKIYEDLIKGKKSD
jgi:glycosyltransferase involved in cell wall biosynthesis